MTEDLDATYETISALQYQQDLDELMELFHFLSVAILDTIAGKEENTWGGLNLQRCSWMNN